MPENFSHSFGFRFILRYQKISKNDKKSFHPFTADVFSLNFSFLPSQIMTQNDELKTSLTWHNHPFEKHKNYDNSLT